ncbi:hypothetical protein BJX63DRAFT_399192 [Aspergillus granulosus]|uniref:Zn(2)-C6 fungal-type domain-containing protein n=1 Tax=Aspergillus granulosus TaxID=176169 RepID=A0ABR4H7K5_9EURO
MKVPSAKRIRIACGHCRRRKTRCTGERPVCTPCQRNGHQCVYEPYSVTVAEGLSGEPDIVARMARLEARVLELSDRVVSDSSSVSDHSVRTSHRISTPLAGARYVP